MEDPYAEPPVEQFQDMGFQPTPNGAPSAEEVLTYTCPTDGYMCPLTANTWGIEFNMYRVRDHETNQLLFEVAKDPDQPPIDLAMIPPEMEDQVRCISYDFGSEFLAMPTVATELQFSVGPQPIHSFRMIERFYFRDFLIRSFDFTFGFVIPNSTNTWQQTIEAADESKMIPASLLKCAHLALSLPRPPTPAHARAHAHTPPRPRAVAYSPPPATATCAVAT